MAARTSAHLLRPTMPSTPKAGLSVCSNDEKFWYIQAVSVV